MSKIYSYKGVEKNIHFFPDYSKSILIDNDKLILGKLTEENLKTLKHQGVRTLKKAPLSDRVFLQQGTVSYKSKHSNTRELFLETLKRNKRSRVALRYLTLLDTQDRNYESAVNNLDVLLRLNGTVEDHENVHRVLTSLSNISEALVYINKTLERRPRWGNRYFLNQFDQINDKNFDDIGQSLMHFTQGTYQQGVDEKLITNYLRQLVRLGKFKKSYRYWMAFVNEDIPSDATIYNPNFEDKLGPPPFNWSEFDKTTYFSGIEPTGGLFVSYSGHKIQTLTDQIVNLNPGQKYRINYNAEWSYNEREGSFFWTITCMGDNSTIFRGYLNNVAKNTSNIGDSFTVPSDRCTSQKIRLDAKPGQYSQRIWARLNSVNISVTQ